MKLDFTKLSDDPKWYDFNTGELVAGDPKTEGREGQFIKIKPFPREKNSIHMRPDGTYILTNEKQKEKYDYCFEDLHGFTDAAEKPIELTPEIKEKIFKYNLAKIPDFVVPRANDFENAKAVQEKN